MKLNPAQREALRMKYGGHCAYCGSELPAKWHADHADPVRRDGSFVRDPKAAGRSLRVWKKNGRLRDPHNDCRNNLMPSCIRCNILKSSASVEGFRSMLTYFAHSIPSIPTYSHVHHLMRFGKLSIDATPVVFWFERYADKDNVCAKVQ
jgi:hypothetical protein